jgi:hypothetical protein
MGAFICCKEKHSPIQTIWLVKINNLFFTRQAKKVAHQSLCVPTFCHEFTELENLTPGVDFIKVGRRV